VIVTMSEHPRPLEERMEEHRFICTVRRANGLTVMGSGRDELDAWLKAVFTCREIWTP
jgi:hypothetical protein